MSSCIRLACHVTVACRRHWLDLEQVLHLCLVITRIKSCRGLLFDTSGSKCKSVDPHHRTCLSRGYQCSDRPAADRTACCRSVQTPLCDLHIIWHQTSLTLAVTSAGYNNIAIEAAQARGVPVCTCPGYNAASVAEGALMMMLMLARRVHEQEVRRTHLQLQHVPCLTSASSQAADAHESVSALQQLCHAREVQHARGQLTADIQFFVSDSVDNVRYPSMAHLHHVYVSCFVLECNHGRLPASACRKLSEMVVLGFLMACSSMGRLLAS